RAFSGAVRADNPYVLAALDLEGGILQREELRARLSLRAAASLHKVPHAACEDVTQRIVVCSERAQPIALGEALRADGDVVGHMRSAKNRSMRLKNTKPLARRRVI